MEKIKLEEAAILFALFTLFFFGGLALGLDIQKRKAVKAGVAYYDSDTNGNAKFKYIVAD